MGLCNLKEKMAASLERQGEKTGRKLHSLSIQGNSKRAKHRVSITYSYSIDTVSIADKKGRCLMNLTNATSKFIEEWLRKYGDMKKERSSKKTLEDIALEAGTEHTTNLTAVRVYMRVRERERIFNYISYVLESMEEDKRLFLQEYYWGSTKKTIGAVSRALFIDERTGKRWKKEFAEEIAQHLGWL